MTGTAIDIDPALSQNLGVRSGHMNRLLVVIAGLVAPDLIQGHQRLFSLKACKKDADARDNPRIKSGEGHGGKESIPSHRLCLFADDCKAKELTD